MVNIDKSQLNVKHRDTLPYGDNLLDFAYQVALAKPLCKLVVDETCIDNIWKAGEATSMLYRIKIFENGEELGFISILQATRKKSMVSVVFVFAKNEVGLLR